MSQAIAPVDAYWSSLNEGVQNYLIEEGTTEELWSEMDFPAQVQLLESHVAHSFEVARAHAAWRPDEKEQSDPSNAVDSILVGKLRGHVP